MQNMNFSTTRLVCRPLEEKDICAFRNIVEEPHVQNFFDIGDVSDFLQNLKQSDCFPLGVYSTDGTKLVGYINGYVYNRQKQEMLVEFFLTESCYRFDYVS